MASINIQDSNLKIKTGEKQAFMPCVWVLDYKKKVKLDDYLSEIINRINAISGGGGSGNLFTSDQSLSEDRSHDLGGNKLLFNNGSVYIDNNNFCLMNGEIQLSLNGNTVKYPFAGSKVQNGTVVYLSGVGVHIGGSAAGLSATDQVNGHSTSIISKSGNLQMIHSLGENITAGLIVSHSKVFIKTAKIIAGTAQVGQVLKLIDAATGEVDFS